MSGSRKHCVCCDVVRGQLHRTYCCFAGDEGYAPHYTDKGKAEQAKKKHSRTAAPAGEGEKP